MIHSTNIINADYVDHENEDGKDKRTYLVVGDLSWERILSAPSQGTDDAVMVDAWYAVAEVEVKMG